MTSIRSLLPIREPATRGAASLVVVMVLFFIITLVAAYTSRNLLFEQRTSANQYRSTLAFETADAGVEWALARLNDAVMNDNCTPLTSAASVTTQPSFRGRFLNIDATTGVITPVAGRIAGCVFNGTGWVCDCPATAGTDPNPTVTYTGNGPFAAFWVRFVQVTGGPGVTGVVRIQVNACTRVDAACLSFTREAQPGDGLATVWSMVSLRSALVSAPAAALTVRETFNDNGRTAIVTNADSTSGGITIHSGNAIPPANSGAVRLSSVPGTPPALSLAPSDATLALTLPDLTPDLPLATPVNRMFNSVFGMWPATYLAQPGLAEVGCAGGCTAAAVNDQIRLNPGHAIYVSGGGLLSIGADIGTAANPVVIIADGNVEFNAGTPTVHGVIYNRSASWDIDGNGTIRGGAISERSFRFDDDDVSIIYDRDVLLRARNQNGSFVKVPGGWRDFQP